MASVAEFLVSSSLRTQTRENDGEGRGGWQGLGGGYSRYIELKRTSKPSTIDVASSHSATARYSEVSQECGGGGAAIFEFCTR